MKNDGYTFIETILAIAILSILLWSILPHVRRLELQGSLQFEQIMEKATVTHLVHTLVIDLSQVHWVYWQSPPSIEKEGKDTKISWTDETGEEKTYRITQKEAGIEITREENKRVYPLPSLEDFSIEETGGEEEGDLVVQISTAHQQISFPIRFGSKAVTVHETQ